MLKKIVNINHLLLMNVLGCIDECIKCYYSLNNLDTFSIHKCPNFRCRYVAKYF